MFRAPKTISEKNISADSNMFKHYALRGLKHVLALKMGLATFDKNKLQISLEKIVKGITNY